MGKYRYIGELVEEEAPMDSVIYEALEELHIGEPMREFILELVAFAGNRDLESREAPMAFLNDAFKDVKALYQRR